MLGIKLWGAKTTMAIEHLHPKEALSRAQAGGVLIDVREPSETAAGHAQGARLLPLSAIATWAPQIAQEGQPVMCICRSGARSLRACQELAALGVSTANVEGGTMGWQAGGLPMA